ncbi:hypothetical protein [uncultured Flavobacterium sp.]|uniref:hypothetical protein n=1 Tax=uncultured Flavobacterium sp. TaxID=165435 RepID=UPI0030CA30DF
MTNTILLLFLIIYILYITNSYYVRQVGVQKLLLIVLLIVHFSAMGFAYSNTLAFPEYDAFSFYKRALNADSWISLFGLGTSFMSFLIYPLVHAGVSLFVLFLLFSAMSYQCFLWYFNQISGYNRKGIVSFKRIPIIQLLFLMPSLHYWTSFLGKDALIFFFLTYLLFEFKNKSKVHFSHLIVLIAFILLRPHVFLAIIGAFVIYLLTQKNILKSIKIKLSILSLVIMSILVPILMFFTHIKTLTFDSISKKFYEVNDFASHGGSGISLIETSYLERIWLLLFRPLFYDAKTNYQYVISFENCIVLFVFVFILINLFTKKMKINIEKDVKLALLSGCCILLIIATYIFNLGLASRMRAMFLPLLFYSLHQIVYFDHEKNT